jgi:hypothetical protein
MSISALAKWSEATDCPLPARPAVSGTVPCARNRHQAGAEISDLVAPNRPLKTHIALKCGPPLHDDAQMDDGTQMEPDGDPLAQILGQFVRNPLQRLVCL